MSWKNLSKFSVVLLVLVLTACTKIATDRVLEAEHENLMQERVEQDEHENYRYAEDENFMEERVEQDELGQIKHKKTLEEIIALENSGEGSWFDYKPSSESDGAGKWQQHSEKDYGIIIDEETSLPMISFQRFYFEDKYIDRINLSSDMLFDFDSAQIGGNTRETFISVASTFRSQLENQHVFVVGHTDAIGSDSYNINLSARRAASVVSLFRENNLPRNSLAAIPAGKHIPRAPNDTEENRAKNRRVEIYVSPWQTLPLRYLQDIDCPHDSCDIADLTVLTVDRDFRLSNSRETSNLPVVVSAMRNSRTRGGSSLGNQKRQVQSMTVIIRADRIEPEVRTIRP